MTRETTPRPVRGSAQVSTSLGAPFLVTCSITTSTRRAPWTRSIAPPMPLTIAPGTAQLAMSPLTATCMAPRTAMSTLPPRIIPNDSAESKNEPPGLTVTVSLPALMRSGSTSSSVGYGPTPSSPFSECRKTSTSSGM